MDGARLHVRGFDRPNLRYEVAKVGGAADKAHQLAELVRMREGGVALVYAATRKNAEAYALELKAAGMKVRVYHAGLENNAREKAQDHFMAGQLDAIVAENRTGRVAAKDASPSANDDASALEVLDDSQLGSLIEEDIEELGGLGVAPDAGDEAFFDRDMRDLSSDEKDGSEEL